MIDFFKKKRMLVIIVGILIIIIVATIISIIISMNTKNGVDHDNPNIISVETDPASGSEIETTTQESESVSGPMFLGFEDLYRNRSGEWVKCAKLTIQYFAKTIDLDVERVSMAKDSFNNTGENYDAETSTSFYFVINNSNEVFKLEAKTMPSSSYHYDIYNQNGKKLHSKLYKTN